MHITIPTEDFRRAAERVQFHPRDMTLTLRGDLRIVPIKTQRDLLSIEAVELMQLFNKPEVCQDSSWEPIMLIRKKNWAIIVSRAESIGRRIQFERGPAFWWLEGPLLVSKEDEMVIAIVLPKPPEPRSGADTKPKGHPTSPESGTPAGRSPPQEQRKINETIAQQPPTVVKKQKDEATDSIAPTTPRERQETQGGKETAVSALKQPEFMISKVTDGRQSVEPHALGVGYILEFYEKEGIQQNIGGIMLAVMVYRWEKLVAGS